MITPFEKINILGAPVAVLDMPGILARYEELIAEPGCATSYAINTHSLNMTYREPAHLAALRSSSLVYADGASILLAARLLGGRLPERLSTTDIWPPLCTIAMEKGYSFYFLGGPLELVEELRRVTQERYPSLKVAGIHDGYFSMDDEAVIEAINAAAPDVLWVGMGDPRQAVWAERHRAKLKAKLVITCGGMFKFITGQMPRAPESWQKAGFEWLHRFMQEPRRHFTRYAFGLPAYGLRVLAQKFFRHRGRLTDLPAGGS